MFKRFLSSKKTINKLFLQDTKEKNTIEVYPIQNISNSNYINIDLAEELADYIVLNATMLKEGVFNDIKYNLDAISNSVDSWNGRPITMGHRKANTPEEADNVIGKVYNTRMEGDKLVAQIYLNKNKLQQNEEGKTLLQLINNKEKIAVSTGLRAGGIFYEYFFNNEKYYVIINSIEGDHLAILLTEEPACKDCFMNEKENFINQTKPLNNMIMNNDNYSGVKTIGQTLDNINFVEKLEAMQKENDKLKTDNLNYKIENEKRLKKTKTEELKLKIQYLEEAKKIGLSKEVLNKLELEGKTAEDVKFAITVFNEGNPKQKKIRNLANEEVSEIDGIKGNSIFNKE